MKNIAVIGLGKWGRNLLREFSNLTHVSICCTMGNRKNVVWLKQNYPLIHHTKNFDEIIHNKKIDAVVIATPINKHFILASKALNAGKHVFVEKTISEKISNAEKLIEVARKKNLTLFVGHIFLYHPVLKKMKTLVKKDPIKHIRLSWNKFGSFKENMIYDLLSHEISIIQDLIGKPKKISILEKKGILTNLDIITLKLIFKKNKQCIIDINRCSTFKKKYISIITKNNFYVWEDDDLFKFNGKMRSFEIHFKTKTTPLEIECKTFLNYINRKKNDLSNAKKALKILQILAKIK